MEETAPQPSGENTTLYYGIGAAVLVLLVAGIYLLRPKQAPTSPISQTGGTGAPLVKPTGPISGLAWEIQYYNPVIGFPRYYLSAEGSDISGAKTVGCNFTISVAGKQVTDASVQNVQLVDEPSRGGKTFICTTGAVDLEPQVPTIVAVAVTDDLKNTTTCSSTFLFPRP